VEVRAVPRVANYTLTFALQLRKKHGKTLVRVALPFYIGVCVCVRRSDGRNHSLL
jgi:hypothetical protein